MGGERIDKRKREGREMELGWGRERSYGGFLQQDALTSGLYDLMLLSSTRRAAGNGGVGERSLPV